MFIIKTEKNIRLNGNKVYLGNDLIFGEHTEEETIISKPTESYMGDIKYEYNTNYSTSSLIVNKHTFEHVNKPSPITFNFRNNDFHYIFTELDNMSSAFTNTHITKLVELPLLNKCENFNETFKNCTELKGIMDLFDFSISMSNPTLIEMFSGCSQLKEVRLFNIGSTPHSDYAFKNCSNLRRVEFSKFTIHQSITASQSINGIFMGCPKLEEVIFHDATEHTIECFREELTRDGCKAKIINLPS